MHTGKTCLCFVVFFKKNNMPTSKCGNSGTLKGVYYVLLIKCFFMKRSGKKPAAAGCTIIKSAFQKKSRGNINKRTTKDASDPKER